MSIIVIINIAVTSCGAVLTILSSIVFCSVAPLRRDKKEDLEILFAVYCSCVIVFGILITTAALITMMMATCQQIDSDRCTRKFYPISLGVLSIALVMGSVLVMILAPMANRHLEPSFIKMYQSAKNGSTHDVNQLQIERLCCGLRTISYSTFLPSQSGKLPLMESCCPATEEDEECTWWNAYKQDCLFVFRVTFDRAINHIAMWALSVVTFLIVAIVLILCSTPR